MIHTLKMAGRLHTIIGPMFSGKCVGHQTIVLRADIKGAMIEPVSINVIEPGDILLDENRMPTRVMSISSSVSTIDNPLYKIDYNAGSYGRASLCATLDHFAVIGAQIKNGVIAPIDMKVCDIMVCPEKYDASFSKPIIGQKYYGITLENGYHFIIQSEYGPVPTHNSSSLINQIERYHIAGKKCIVIKHSIDLRDGGALSIRTHDNLIHSLVPVQYSPTLFCPEIDKIFEAHEVIGIDEIQFFAMYDRALGTQIAEYLSDWVARGKTIICVGLDSDWKCDVFGVIEPLVVRSDRVKKLCAICMRCGKKASFSARSLVDAAQYDNPIGGSEKYVALCRICYREHMRTSGDT